MTPFGGSGVTEEIPQGTKVMTEATISAAAMRIVKLLVGSPPQPVSELIKLYPVTRTAITEQLAELREAGFVERTTEPLPGRGRPHHLYRATDAALLLLFANNQNLVVPAIWQALAEEGGPELVAKIRARVSRTVAEHYKQKITSQEPAQRLREFGELMEREGGMVEVSGNGHGLVLRKLSCSFLCMFDQDRTICRLDEEIIAEVVGCPVRRVLCRHDGDACCSFELANHWQH